MPTKQKDSTPFQSNDNLPTLHIDGVALNHRSDNMTLVALISLLPDKRLELVRFIVSDEDLMNMIDGFCDAVNYYPKSPEKKKRKSS